MSAEADLVRDYLARVVNNRDLSAVQELVSPAYVGTGHGWPVDRDSLRAFYEWQVRSRPDWHIDVQESMSVGGCVVVRAHAGGTVTDDAAGRPAAAPVARAVEWLAAYRVVNGQITGIDLLEIRDRSQEAAC